MIHDPACNTVADASNGLRADDASRPRAPRSRSARCAWLMLILGMWICTSGAGCPNVLRQYSQPIPRALPTNASLEQIVNVVNDNSARVQSLSTSRATVSTPGFPSLDANIAFQRPRSFRLVGQKFLGPEVDLGSNDEVLWFWMKRAQPPALFFCRHDQYAATAARQIIPVEPEWLIEAFGVVTLDPTTHIEGPSPVGAGRVEIRTTSNIPGRGSRVIIVDDSRGIILEEHVYDAQRQRLASAVLSKHVRDPASGVTLPRHVEIQWPPAKLELSIDMPDVQINQVAPGTALFVKPTYSGYNEIDLAQPSQLAPPTPAVGGPYRAAPQARY